MSLAYRADPDPRGSFVDAEIRDAKANARGWAVLVRTDDGYAIDGRRYVALDCHCADRACPGFAMVHDEPGARTHFARLFGGGCA